MQVYTWVCRTLGSFRTLKSSWTLILCRNLGFYTNFEKKLTSADCNCKCIRNYARISGFIVIVNWRDADLSSNSGGNSIHSCSHTPAGNPGMHLDITTGTRTPWSVSTILTLSTACIQLEEVIGVAPNWDVCRVLIEVRDIECYRRGAVYNSNDC